MPRDVTLNDVKIHNIRIEWDVATQTVGMRLSYTVLDSTGTPFGGWHEYTHTLTPGQTTALRNILVNDVLPAIKAIEGI